MTRGADAARVRRLGTTAFVLLVALGVALGLRACDESPLVDSASPPAQPTTGEARERAAADDRGRRRVDVPSRAEDVTGDPPEAADVAAPPGPSERVSLLSPPWTELDVARHEIEGRVISIDGVPLSGVTVTLVSTWLDGAVREALLRTDAHSRHLTSSMTTGSDGTFRLEYVEGGARNLVVGDMSRPSVVADVRPGEMHEIVVPTEPRRLTVSVVDAAGRPAPQVHVWATAALPWAESPLSSRLAIVKAGTTDASGMTVLDDVTVGTVQLRAHRQGTTMMPQVAAAVIPVDGDAETTIRLHREVPVRVRVLDAASGEPIARAFAYDRSRMAVSGFSNAEGLLELPMPLESRSAARIFVDHADYAGRAVFAIVHDEPTETTVCDVAARLERAASATVRCVDETGAPLRRVTVVLRSAYVAADEPIRTIDMDSEAAETGANGRATIRGLHPGGGLPLNVVLMRGGVVQVDRDVTPLQPGEQRDLGEIVVSAGRALTGRVRDAAGDVVIGAIVIAVPRRPDAGEDDWRPALAGIALTGQGRRSETGDDGRFAIGGIAPGLVDVLVVEPRPGLLKEGVAVTSGSDPAPLDLRLPRTVTIRGRVVRADGASAAGVTIIFPIPGPVDLNAIEDTTTDEDGRFELPGFAANAAPFDVRVLDDAGGVTIHTIDPRGGEATLRLE